MHMVVEMERHCHDGVKGLAMHAHTYSVKRLLVQSNNIHCTCSKLLSK